MNRPIPGEETGRVRLREVEESDLPILFEHQRDPVSTRMAAFPSREREAFMAHWAKIRADPTNRTQAILFDGQVAGTMLSWEHDGAREVGYWLGQEYWGQGIATQALAAFLQQVTARPLYARVAKHNVGSRRVLEKSGFTVCGEDPGEVTVEGAVVEVWILILRSPEDPAAPINAAPPAPPDH